MKKVLLIVCLLAVAAALGFYVYLNKPHRQVQDENAVYSLTASELYNAFEENEKRAEKKYLNKTIEVTGQVGEVLTDRQGKNVLILKNEDDLFGVKCSISAEDSSKAETVSEGDVVTLKCICTGGGGGFDVEMVRCRFTGEQK